MAGDVPQLRVEPRADGWALAGERAGELALVNDFLGYLSDRNYSPRTVRAYAFDLLHFARWLSAEGLALDEVEGDVLLEGRDPALALVEAGQHGAGQLACFGSWTAGLRAAGLEPAYRTWTRAQIVEALRAWADAQGRPPQHPDWHKHSHDHPAAATVSRRFGGWQRALQAAGLDDGRRRWTADEVLDAIRAHTSRHGRPPLSSERCTAASLA
jgi:hypothetical protein